MLDPEYLARIAEGAEDLAELLHQDIIKKVVQRIMARLDRGDDYYLTAVDKWQLETLQEAGFLREDIQKEIAQKTPLMLSEVKEAFEDAGIHAIDTDNSVYRAAGLEVLPINQHPALIEILERGYAATLGEFENFTRTTADAAQTQFISACDKAFFLVSSGAESAQTAVQEAVDELVKSGVYVQYPSGHKDTIETAVTRAVRTGIAKSCGESSLALMQEMEWDIVLTTAHIGARYGDGGENHTNHEWWQGKFYSRSGNDKRFPRFDVCGLGYVDGLHGANCRHSFGPGDGEHNPYEGTIDTEENRRVYDLQQRQRTLERRIRKTKREVLTFREAIDNANTTATKENLEESYKKKAALLAKQNGAYNEFCKENDLQRRSDRVRIAQWDRKQAAAARAAARKQNNGAN